MNIGLLGGAFNPPHLGHQLIARQILDFTDVDQVWLLPNYGHQYFGIAQYKETASAEHRLAMTRLLEASHISASTIEIDQKTSGQTIELLPLLPPEHKFSFIIGSDQLSRFSEWQGYKELLRVMRFLVFPRFGYPIEGLYEHMEVVDRSDLLVTTNISSTKIRARVAKGLSLDGFVPEAVAKYIYENGLYREGIGPNKEVI